MSAVSREHALASLDHAIATLRSWRDEVNRTVVYEREDEDPPEYVSVRDLEGFDVDQFRAELTSVASMLEVLAST